MGTKPTTKAELVEYISNRDRLSALTVPALNTIWGILHRSKRPKKTGSGHPTGGSELVSRPPFPPVGVERSTLEPVRPRGRVRFEAEAPELAAQALNRGAH